MTLEELVDKACIAFFGDEKWNETAWFLPDYIKAKKDMRAAIAIVAEECAKVADDRSNRTVPYVTSMFHAGYRDGANAAAAAIRALLPKENER